MNKNKYFFIIYNFDYLVVGVFFFMIMFMYNIFILDFLELREDNFCKVNK